MDSGAYMKHNDARVKLLRYKIDAIVECILNQCMDEVVDNIDHYLIGTLRQPDVDINVFNKVTYYVNGLRDMYCPNLKW